MTRKTGQRRDSLEKTLRYILGTAPDEFGLRLDGQGYVPLKALTAALRDEEGWRGLREGDIAALLNQPGEASPFEATEGLIRLKPAGRGPLPAPRPAAPPKILYAALKPAAWAAVSRHGLYPKTGETEVRLWPEAEPALRAGRRLSFEAVLITVQAQKAGQAGIFFQLYGESLWLTDGVPAAFLSGPPAPEEKEKEPRRKEATEERPPEKAPETPAEPEIHRGKKKGRHGDAPDWKNQVRRERRRR